MANNNYRLYLEAKLDPKKLQTEITNLSTKNILFLKVDYRKGDFAKFEQELAKIKSQAASLEKVTLFGDDKGGINKAIVQYKDVLGNIVKQTVDINSKVKITQTYTENLVKDEREINRLLERRMALTAKQKDEMAKASLNAEKFIARSQNLQQTKEVSAAVAKAQEIKVAVSKGDINAVRQLNDEFAVLKARLTTGRTGLDSWVGGLKNAIKQTVEYSISIGLIYGALNKIKEGITFISELDGQMNKVRLVTGMTNEEVADLAISYNGLAKELGATTNQVAAGSLEWFRQGKSIEETRDLLRSSVMLSKLGNVESAQSTEYLTSIVNAFRLEAEETEEVISKLLALDNAFATSVSEIASAMQRSSVSAQQAGVSLEELASMITVVSDVTRRAPESIGEALPDFGRRHFVFTK